MLILTFILFSGQVQSFLCRMCIYCMIVTTRKHFYQYCKNIYRKSKNVNDYIWFLLCLSRKKKSNFQWKRISLNTYSCRYPRLSLGCVVIDSRWYIADRRRSCPKNRIDRRRVRLLPAHILCNICKHIKLNQRYFILIKIICANRYESSLYILCDKQSQFNQVKWLKL